MWPVGRRVKSCSGLRHHISGVSLNQPVLLFFPLLLFVVCKRRSEEGHASMCWRGERGREKVGEKCAITLRREGVNCMVMSWWLRWPLRTTSSSMATARNISASEIVKEELGEGSAKLLDQSLDLRQMEGGR